MRSLLMKGMKVRKQSGRRHRHAANDGVQAENRAQILAKLVFAVGDFWQWLRGIVRAVSVGGCLHCPRSSV